MTDEERAIKTLKGWTREEAVAEYDYYFRVALDSGELDSYGEIFSWIDQNIKYTGWSTNRLRAE